MGVAMARLTRILTFPLLLVFSFRLTAVTAAQGPIVTLDYGSFEGNLTGNSLKFLGIPFAAPPCVIPIFLATVAHTPLSRIGNLRFAPAEAPIPFKGVRQATAFGAACFQQSLGASAQSLSSISTNFPQPSVFAEDCELRPLTKFRTFVVSSPTLSRPLHQRVQTGEYPRRKEAPGHLCTSPFPFSSLGSEVLDQWIHGGKCPVYERRCKLNVF